MGALWLWWQGFAPRVGEELLTWSWHAAGLVVLVWLATFLLRSMHARVRGALWLAALLLIPLLPIMVRLSPLPSTSVAELASRMQLAKAPAPPAAEATLPAAATAASIEPVSPAAPTAASAEAVSPAPEAPSAALPEPMVAARPQPEAGVSAFSGEGPFWVGSAVLAWALIAALRIARVLASLLWIRKLVRSAGPVGDARLAQAFATACAQIGVSKRVELLSSDLISVPVTVGLVRAAVIVPRDLTASGRQGALDHVLYHELAHVRRSDAAVTLYRRVLEAVLFFHPFLWLASRRYEVEQEHICDDWAVAALGDRGGYARALTELAEQATHAAPVAALGFAHRPSIIRLRVTRVLEEQGMPQPRLSPFGLLTVATVSLLLLALTTSFPLFRGATEAGAAEEPKTASGGTPGAKVTLPGGATVELLALSYHPSEGQVWWQADGSLTECPYGSLRGIITVHGSTQRLYEIVIRKLGPSGMTVRCPGSSTDWPTGKDGEPFRVCVLAFPESQRSASVKLGLANGEWRTLAEAGTDGATMTSGSVTAESGGPREPVGEYSVIFAAPVESADRLVLAVTHQLAREMDYRIVLIAADGKTHLCAPRSQGTPGFTQSTVHFDGMSLAQVDRFLFQVRPYQWVEFRNVSLEPGRKTQVEVVAQPAGSPSTTPSGVGAADAVLTEGVSTPLAAGSAEAQQAPKVVAMVPPSGTTDVDPTLTELRVTFDQDMGKGFSWTGGGETYPKLTAGPHWVDARTCVLPVALEPGHAYQLGINSPSHRNFKSASGVPVVWVRWRFSTKSADPPAPTAAPEKPAAEAGGFEKNFIVQGTVTDGEGKPLPGVRVTAHCGEGTLQMTGEATTAADGKYVLRFGPGLIGYEEASGRPEVPVQEAIIAPRKAGWYEKSLHRQGGLLMAAEMPPAENLWGGWGAKPERVVLPLKPKQVDFVMLAGAVIEGRLLDAGGRPRPPQTVCLTGKELPPSSGVVASAETDAEGRFSLSGVPLKPFSFSFEIGRTESNTIAFERPATYEVVLTAGENGSTLVASSTAATVTPVPGPTPATPPTGQPPSPAPAAAATATEMTLKHDDGTMEGKRSLGASGHFIQFETPEPGKWYLTEVQVFGSRYGSVEPPPDSFTITLCDGEFKTVKSIKRPYSIFQQGEEQWYNIPVAPVELPGWSLGVGEFESYWPAPLWLNLGFNPSSTKGVYVGYDTSDARCFSKVGLPDQTPEPPPDNGDWMVRLVVTQNPPKQVAPELGAWVEPPKPARPWQDEGLVEVKNDDGESDGKMSMGGTGPASRFEGVPEGATLTRLRMFASRYGSGFDPETTFADYYVFDDEKRILQTGRIPYSLFTYEGKWVDVPLKPVKVPSAFWVLINPQAHQSKGIYTHYDTDIEATHSKSGRIPEEMRDLEKKWDWMIRAYVQPAGPAPAAGDSLPAMDRDYLVGWFRLKEGDTVTPDTIIPVFKTEGTYYSVSTRGFEVPFRTCPEGLESALPPPSSMVGTTIGFDETLNAYYIAIVDSLASEFSDGTVGIGEKQPMTRIDRPSGLLDPTAPAPRTNDDFLGWYQPVWFPWWRWEIRKEGERYLLAEEELDGGWASLLVQGPKGAPEWKSLGEPSERTPLPDGLGFALGPGGNYSLIYNEALKRFEMTRPKSPGIRMPLARIPAPPSPQGGPVPELKVEIGIPSWH